jgi:Tat protein secretion system quality control protein TatD with DNase activity
MAPEPHRGTPAHPGHIGLIGKKVAEVKNIPVEVVLDQTIQNAQNMYGCFQL